MTPEQYLATLSKITGALAITLAPIVRAVFRSGLGDSRKVRVNRAAPKITEALRIAREGISRLTEEWMRAQAEQQVKVTDPFIPEPAGYSEEAVREVLNAAIDRQLDDFRPRDMVTREVVSTFDRHARQVGRQMVADAVEPIDGPDVTIEEKERAAKEPKDGPEVPDKQPAKRERAKDRGRPVAYARVLTGKENCGFCVMLASRGAVYKSKETAKYSWAGDKYHDRCDCYPMPVYTSKDWPGKDQADLAYAYFRQATKGYSQHEALLALRRDLYAREQAGLPLFPGFERQRPRKKK